MALAPEGKAQYGSDLIVDLLEAFGISHVAANPGATFRGVHDSLVNYRPARPGRVGAGGPAGTELVEVCHEEIGVAMAHGYAKLTGRPMAVLLHNVVGLAHAAMAIFNAWCDRVPVLLLGGTGPVDAARRRPWIDWVHTAQLQAEMVRPFLKWDDQPAGHRAMIESFIQGYRLSMADPAGPVYICLDAALQEDPVVEALEIPDPYRYPLPSPPAPDPESVNRVLELLAGARQPVFLVEALGRLSGSAGAWLEELALAFGAPVLEVTRSGSCVRNTFALDLTGCEEEVLAEADVVVAFGVRDLEEALSRTDDTTRAVSWLCPPSVRLVDVSLRALSCRGWLPETGRVVPLAASVTARPDMALQALLERLRAGGAPAGAAGSAACVSSLPSGSGEQSEQARRQRLERWSRRHEQARRQWEEQARHRAGERPISLPAVALALRESLRGRDWVLANGTARGWARRLWQWERPDAFLGDSGGAGKGYGLGAAMGAALALKGSSRIAVNLQGDGDLLYTPSGLWTAANQRLALLTVVLNNRSYYEDEDHQQRVAQARGRPVDRAGIGTRITDPDVDFAWLARSMGVVGIGPVERPEELPAALDEAVRLVAEQQRPVVVDVVTQPR